MAESLSIAAEEARMPIHLVYDSRYVRKTPAVEQAELALYRCALLEWRRRRAALDEYWKNSMEGPQVLFRKARVLKLPVMKRVVNGTSGEIARGQAYGLSVCQGKQPVLANSSQKVVDMVKEAAKQLRARAPEFTFTTIQVVLNGRALLHCDSNNAGGSMVISLGPSCGGELVFYDEEAGSHKVIPRNVWTSLDGRRPHHVLPFAGERLALVAYTHSTAYCKEAKNCSDALVKQGFVLPADFGSSRVFPSAPSATDAYLQRAGGAYECIVTRLCT